MWRGLGQRVSAEIIHRRNDMIEIKDFKGNPMLVLKQNERDTFPFQFGLRKARLILENVESIAKFVEENTQQA